MDYLKSKALAVLRWVKDLFASGWNYTVDPPPAHLKAYFWLVLAYFWLVLAISIGGYFLWAPIVNGFKWFAGPVYQAAAPLPPLKRIEPVYLVPSLPDVVTTVPPTVTLKAVEVAPKKPARRKAYRKPKCQTVLC